MSTIIDADAAKLAGLQIDLLQKLRLGHVTLNHLEWFNGLNTETRDAFVRGEKHAPKPSPVTVPTEKFTLFVDLGIITVPDNYVHNSRLDTFKAENEDKFQWGYHPGITDTNFANPTRILKPGNKFGVRIFKQAVSGSTTSEERMEFLATQKAVLVGAQGASLDFEQKRDKLPKGYWYVSFDEKNALPVIDGCHRVPYVSRYSDGVFKFGLGDFEEEWNDGHCLLCFCDIEQPLGA